MDALLAVIKRSRYQGYDGKGDYFLEQALSQEASPLQYRLPQPEAPFVYTGVHILHPRLFNAGLAEHTGGVKKYSLKKAWDYAEKSGRLYGLLFNGQAADLGSISGYEMIREKKASSAV